MFWIIFLASWGLSMYVAQQIGNGKERTNQFVWALFLGWLGVIIVACRGKSRDRREDTAAWRHHLDGDAEVLVFEKQLKMAELNRKLDQLTAGEGQ